MHTFMYGTQQFLLVLQCVTSFLLSSVQILSDPDMMSVLVGSKAEKEKVVNCHQLTCLLTPRAQCNLYYPDLVYLEPQLSQLAGYQKVHYHAGTEGVANDVCGCGDRLCEELDSVADFPGPKLNDQFFEHI